MSWQVSEQMQDLLETTFFQDPETGEEVTDVAPAEDDEDQE